ncbi:MAG TPA: hypothetical protein ENO23_04560, partial [Alphaproteobacteria bacterium]|nr:hypothetical protein [Alphaproteobacteria bacterium]
YSEENTFAEDVSDRARLDDTIAIHAESVARRLRRDGVRGRTIVLKWRDARRAGNGPRGGYPLHTRQTTLAEPTDDGVEIAREARRLLARAGPEGPVRLVGVGVAGLDDEPDAQLSLFADSPGRHDRAGRDALNRAIDAINDRFGPGAVGRANRGVAERAGLSFQIKRGEDTPPENDRDTTRDGIRDGGDAGCER